MPKGLKYFLKPLLNEKNGVPYYYHQNELNSVEAISGGNGSVRERYQYDVFGKPTRYDSAGNIIAGSITGNRVGFTGQEYDSASNSYRFFYRNYSASTGTFNQRDLIGYADGMGMYQYVGNNPANGVDVLGLECKKTSKEIFEETYTNINGHIGNFVGTAATLNDVANDVLKGIGSSEVGFSNNKVFKAANYVSQGSQIAVLSDMLSRDQGNISQEEYNIRAAEIRIAKINLTGDAVGDSPAGKFLKAPLYGLKAIAAVDAASQEITGKSLSRHYAEMDDNAQARGRYLAKNIRGSQERFNRHEEQLRYITKKFGKDQSNWTNEWKEMYEIHQNAKEADFTYTSQEKKNRNMYQCNEDGTRKYKIKIEDNKVIITYIQANDPNLIIGPAGEPTKAWVSVKDRLPYTILYENDSTASAPAKYVKITTPIEPKQDPATFELGSFGFNNETFTIPNNTAAYYQRLDSRDSSGLFVDITAGYDQMNNLAFWEFQSIDPVTLLPPADPFSGFLFLQDSTQANYGNGFVNFSIKPRTNSITLDTISAKASIIFDALDTIATNIHKNTIDAFAPTSNLTALPATSNNPVALSWTGADDVNGCGIRFYTLYVSTDGTNFSILKTGITRTDTTLTVAQGSSYYFFVLATDSVGNMETLRPGAVKNTFIGAPLPVSLLSFNGKTVKKDNMLEWVTSSEQDSKWFEVERSFTGNNFSKIGTVNAAGTSNTTKNYAYTDAKIDKLNSTVMYYRLKLVDVNNSFKYSNIVRLNYNDKNIVPSILYPNPTQGIISISFGDPSLMGTMAILSDANGRQLQQIKIIANTQSFNLSSYTNGVYFIQLKNKEVLKVVKQ